MENGSKNAAGPQEILYVSKNFKDFAKKDSRIKKVIFRYYIYATLYFNQLSIN